MRINDEFTGIYSMFEELSPEVMRAQRLAELEQIARYRALKLVQYQAWSDPVQRSQIQENLKRGEEEAKTAGLTQEQEPRPLRNLGTFCTITPFHKAQSPKRSWFERLFGRK